MKRDSVMEESSLAIEVIELNREVLDPRWREGAGAEVDVVLLPIFLDERPLQGLAGHLDWRSSGYLSGLLREGMCSGLLGEALLLPGTHGAPMKRLVLVGSGKSTQWDEPTLRALAIRLVDMACSLVAGKVMLALPSVGEDRFLLELFFSAITDQVQRRFDAYQSDCQRIEWRSIGEQGALESICFEQEGPSEGELEGENVMDSSFAWAYAEQGDCVCITDESNQKDGAQGGLESACNAERVKCLRGMPTSWCFVVEPEMVVRLRRLLVGPPRAAIKP